MRLLIESTIIFFGTLFAAALLALGEPASSGAPRHGGHQPATDMRAQAQQQHTAADRPSL